MKNIGILILANLIFFLAGCGENKSASSTQQVDEKVDIVSETQEPQIIFYSREDALEALDHENIKVRWQAINFIKAESNTAFEDLKAAIDSSREDVATAAISAITQIESPDKVIPILINALDHKFSTAKAEAVMCLGILGPDAKQAIPFIKERISENDERFRIKAEEALQSINR